MTTIDVKAIHHKVTKAKELERKFTEKWAPTGIRWRGKLDAFNTGSVGFGRQGVYIICNGEETQFQSLNCTDTLTFIHALPAIELHLTEVHDDLMAKELPTVKDFDSQ